MSEQQQQPEKKKRGVFLKILNWIGSGLLGLLLIAAIIFQTPWKVITLLVILLLACTVLPKPTRKWFWLSVGIVVIALIIWVFLPEDNEGWRPFTFDEELDALQAKYAIPNEENAAIIYDELLAGYDANAFDPNISDPNIDRLTSREPWLSKDYPGLAGWLDSHKNTITSLIKAAKIEKCAFPIDANFVMSDRQMDRLSAMRRFAYLLIRAANNDITEERTDQTIEKYTAVLQIGKHLCQQPTITDVLTGLAIEGLPVKMLNNFIIIGNATEEQLIVIEEAIAGIKHDWNSDFPKILEHEKLTTKSHLSLFYEVNAKGRIRRSRDSSAVIRAHLPQAMPPLVYWEKKLAKAGVILSWFFLPATSKKAGEIIDSAYERYYAMTEPDFDWQKEPEEVPITSLFSISFRFNYSYMVNVMAKMSEQVYYRIPSIYRRAKAEQNGCLLIIALKRYKDKAGRWPESLDDIKSLVPAEIFIDPINNDSFVYKLTEDNFTLYSKGENNIDEDGQFNTIWDPNSFESMIEQDDRLIWPPKKRKTEKEDTDDK